MHKNFWQRWRSMLWAWLRSNQPEGVILPKRLIVARAVLFPIEFFLWRARIYDPSTDIWNFHGIRFTTSALQEISNREGRLLRVVKIEGGVVHLESLPE